MQHPNTLRWRARRGLGLSVALLAFLVPIALAVAGAIVLSRVLPRPEDGATVVAWWVLLTAATTVVLVAVERATRRLLPLAALLRMSLVFPDRAPSRFRMALRAAGVRDLERRVVEARDRGASDEPLEAAERIITLMGALAMHDRTTRGHSERVRAFTDLLADELRLSDADREKLRWAALLHDIGKLAVPPAILNKDGKPSRDEWAVIHRHPAEGARMAEPLRAWLGPWADAIAHHHEKWDGSGYPFGLHGEDISYGARIVAVADSFEVMTSPRSYKRPMPAADTRRELAVCAGTHFDPVAVRAFLNVSLGRLRWAMGPLAWLAQVPFVGGIPRMALRPAAQRPPVTGAAVGAIALALGPAPVATPHAVAEDGPAVEIDGPAPAVLGERIVREEGAEVGDEDLRHVVVGPRPRTAPPPGAPAPATTVAPSTTPPSSATPPSAPVVEDVPPGGDAPEVDDEQRRRGRGLGHGKGRGRGHHKHGDDG